MVGCIELGLAGSEACLGVSGYVWLCVCVHAPQRHSEAETKRKPATASITTNSNTNASATHSNTSHVPASPAPPPAPEAPPPSQAEWHEAWLKLQRALEEHRESQERFLWRAAAEASTEASLASLARTASAAAAAELSDPGDAGAASGANWASGVSTQEGPGPRHSETTQRLEDARRVLSLLRCVWGHSSFAPSLSRSLPDVGDQSDLRPNMGARGSRLGVQPNSVVSSASPPTSGPSESMP